MRDEVHNVHEMPSSEPLLAVGEHILMYTLIMYSIQQNVTYGNSSTSGTVCATLVPGAPKPDVVRQSATFYIYDIRYKSSMAIAENMMNSSCIIIVVTKSWQ